MWSRRRRLGTDPLTCLLLETLPPLFSVGLIGSLSWASYTLSAPEWFPLILVLQAEILIHWIQFHRHSSIIPTSTKNFPGYVHRYPSMTGYKEEVQTTKWEECESCDMHVPLGSRHCSHCRRCIHLKDHHCYFLGACVGSNNKRFFLSFVIYASLGSLFATLSILKEMSLNRNLLSMDGASLFLPANIALYFYDQSSLLEILYVSLLNFGIGAFLFTTFMFFVGVYGMLTGRNFFRRNKKRENKILQEEDPVEHKNTYSDVFGSCGWIVILIPFTPFSLPSIDPGYRRIITYNNDFVLNGIVTHCDTPPHG
uniref:Palmitoyltransferase n=1 Tax=Caligus clemensi TaxID=344056 RepID=C1C1S1_CALCM|nr:Probable palmitoyltransferase ZDHHC21 [Caligus clemensi]